ncbi:TPA: AAA family ATPase [Serratia marcescens]|uniref:DNA transposition protein n=1 Tax=Serratia marcescens TaxID=615 RepID=A0AB33G830_SERMA|nr:MULTISPECIES: AAA family ATPase [Serratia]AKL43332.1 DNA transposition protein [Serratia marcescens]AWL70686.1 DNA transposition protein [Serratia marcescens]MDP8603912.1 AAA family ATPase [Serratia marcescens]MDP8613121.1 AAA family ATPase [Serratia marcescens]MDP8642883.1 AAA family ATPase [Serratia marcescens]
MKEQNQVGFEEIRTAITEILDTTDFTSAQLAREAGLSAARFSQFLGNTYKGDNKKVADALAIWLKNYHAKRDHLPAMPEFVQTPTVLQIWGAFQYAQLARCITVIHGNPGVSKTTAVREFVVGRPNVWTIKASKSRASVLECLFDLALAVGIDQPICRRGALSRQILQRLSRTGGLLIIDEADVLEYDTLEEIRILQEETDIGLALIGNHNIYKRMTGNNSRNVDFARLFSRIAKRVVINQPRKGDIEAVAKAWGLVDNERDLIHWLAKQPGALRITFFVLRLAATFAQAQREPMSEVHIKAAMKDLGCDAQKGVVA